LSRFTINTTGNEAGKVGTTKSCKDIIPANVKYFYILIDKKQVIMLFNRYYAKWYRIGAFSEEQNKYKKLCQSLVM